LVLPWIFYIEDLDDEDMGDLEYIESKVLAGNYFQSSGDINTTTEEDEVAYTPATGKTAFLLQAKIVNTTHPDLAVTSTSLATTQQKNVVQAALQIGGITKDTTNIGTQSMSDTVTGGNSSIIRIASGNGSSSDGKFNVLGLSLVGNGSSTIKIVKTVDDGSAFATMSGYLVDT